MPRKFRAVIAGKGFLDKDRNESIMQLDKFKARSATNVERQSGISAKRLAEMSRDCNVFATGDRPDAVNVVRPLSARLKCRKNRHLDIGRIPNDIKFEELPRGVPSCPVAIESELPDDLRSFGIPLLDCPLECA